jgi:predicted  nucleic acid-binding Zn-ribbon protein
MHSDLVKLLDLQSQDLGLLEIEARLADVAEMTATLDRAVAAAENGVSTAARAVADATQRRAELEAKIETFRVQQERRRQAIEMTHPGKRAATLMAELDLARSVLAQEESEWVRLADQVTSLEAKVTEAEAGLDALREEQVPERASLAARESDIQAERNAALKVRAECAARVEKRLLTRYDRLRQSRSPQVVVPMSGAACGSCFTAVPLHRRSLIKSGAVVEGCEVCGVILYIPEGEQ